MTASVPPRQPVALRHQVEGRHGGGPDPQPHRDGLLLRLESSDFGPGFQGSGRHSARACATPSANAAAGFKDRHRTAELAPKSDAVLFRSFYGENTSCNGLGVHRELIRRGTDLTLYCGQGPPCRSPDGGVPCFATARSSTSCSAAPGTSSTTSTSSTSRPSGRAGLRPDVPRVSVQAHGAPVLGEVRLRAPSGRVLRPAHARLGLRIPGPVRHPLLRDAFAG